ncbi:FORKED 1 protein [Tanacetum coccineum]
MFGTGLQANEVVTASLTNAHSLRFLHQVGGTDYDSHHEAYGEWRAYGVKLSGFGTINENRLQGYYKAIKAILRTIVITDKFIWLYTCFNEFIYPSGVQLKMKFGDNNPVEESHAPSPTIAFCDDSLNLPATCLFMPADQDSTNTIENVPPHMEALPYSGSQFEVTAHHGRKNSLPEVMVVNDSGGVKNVSAREAARIGLGDMQFHMKIKVELDTLDRTKDEEVKKFKMALKIDEHSIQRLKVDLAKTYKSLKHGNGYESQEEDCEELSHYEKTVDSFASMHAGPQVATVGQLAKEAVNKSSNCASASGYASTSIPSIAAAATLVAAQCVEVAEAMGTELEHLIVAVNMSSHDDKVAAY